MSEVARLADEEATRAEAENPDEATPIEPVEPDEPSGEELEGDEVEGAPPVMAPEGVPPAVEGMSEKELEKSRKRLDTAAQTYARKVAEIMGEEAQMLEPCPRCATTGFPGFIFPPLMAPVDPDTKAAVLLSVGEEAPNVSKTTNKARRCDECEGWGRVLSGSRLNQQKTLRCVACEGKGWVAVGDEYRVAQQAVTEPAPPNGSESPVEQPPDVDPWGRTPSDPDYGRLPNFAGQR